MKRRRPTVSIWDIFRMMWLMFWMGFITALGFAAVMVGLVALMSH